jgi:hypothetical protein
MCNLNNNQEKVIRISSKYQNMYSWADNPWPYLTEDHGFIKTEGLIFESSAPQGFQKLRLGFY